MVCRGEKIGNPLVDGILYPAGSATEFSLENLLLVLCISMQCELSLADRTAQNIHQRPLHTSSSRMSII
jgi:hypothetical protein